MTIIINKFGDMLASRQDGREAFAAFRPSLTKISNNETVEVDFVGVKVFAPSWGDEFFRPLLEMFGTDRIIFKNTQNSSVIATLKFLEQLKGVKLKIES